MKRLELIVKGNTALNPVFAIDNQVITPKKGENRSKVYAFETEKDEVDVSIYTWYEIEGKRWLLISIIYFIISLFGLFDVKENKKMLSLKYNGKVKLVNQENVVNLTFSGIKKDSIAFKIDGDMEDNETNKYYSDDELVRRKNLLKKIKKFILIGAAIILILIFILIIVL